MSFCPNCRAPAQPGATQCIHCRSPIAAGPPAGYGAPPAPGGYGAPPGGGYGAPPAPGGYGAPPAPGGYGAPPAPGGYGAPPGGGYGAPPAPGGYGAPPAPGSYGAPPAPGGYGAPPAPGGFGPAPAGGFGPGPAYGAPSPAYGAPGGSVGIPPAPQIQKSTGLGGCGIAAIIGAVVAVLGGLVLVLILVAAASASDDDDDVASNPPSTPQPVAPQPGQPEPQPIRDDIPDTGALRALIKDRVGSYSLSGVGEITSLSPILQGGVVDSKAAQYLSYDGKTVELFLVVYASQGIAAGKMLALESAMMAEKAPHEVVTKSTVFNKQQVPVGTRLRLTNTQPLEAVYWTNGKLLGFVRAPAPHAVGFELVAPF